MHELALFFLIVPIALYGVALLSRTAPGMRPAGVLNAARGATGLGVVLALALAGLAAWAGPLTTPLLGGGGVGLSLRVDGLAVTMALLVAVVGALIVQFSRNYLDGDPRQGAFTGMLCATIASVLLLVLAGNLYQLVAAWIATSLALHPLLVFYRDRPAAVAAARKKFIVARLGDVCLVGAAVLIAQAFGSADIAAILEAGRAAAADGTVPAAVGTAAILLVVAAALKSAMFPTHGWLLEVMETPTPVSALLHAGLINAGTFLIVRFGDVVLLSTPATLLLIAIGTTTALIASLAMITQSSVKVSLAYSSAAHMGFMLMLCGMGAHAAAMLHLVAHSFYKAHAFLSSGSAVEYARGLDTAAPQHTPSPALAAAALGLSTALFVGLGLAVGAPLAERPAHMALGAMLVMATGYLIVSAIGDRPKAFVVLWGAGFAAAVTLSFFVLEAAATVALAGSIAAVPDAGAATLAAIGLVLAAFGSVILLQTWLPRLQHVPAARQLFVDLKHGFYANTLFDRLVGTLR